MNHIIQPHSDDTLLSMGGFLLENPNTVFKIHTVHYEEKRYKEDLNLQSIIPNISFEHWNCKNLSHKQYWSRFRELTLFNVSEFLTPDFNTEAITNKFIELDLEDNNIYLPMGLGHPMHLLVSYIGTETLHKANTYYYIEFPHAYKQRNLIALDEARNVCPNRIVMENKELLQKKFELFKQIYKSQSAILFHEKRFVDQLPPEEIYY